MAEVRPFRGLLYDKLRSGGDYSSVMAPPYDVISDQMREELYGKSDFNIIKLILGKSFENDTESDNKYTRAKDFLSSWIKEGVLAQDDAESFYIYLQEYSVKGQMYRRVGFLGLMKIEGDDVVLPHEHTLSKPKEDRMNLIKEVQSNLSPIFTVYDDNTGAIKTVLEEVISKTEPIIDVDLSDGSHKLWRLPDEEITKKITDEMSAKKVFIADGHHRYSVARSYRDARRAKDGYDGSADHILMYFSDMSDSDNLTIFPTHRVIKEMPLDEGEAREKLSEYFDITEYEDLGSLMENVEASSDKEHVFGFFAGGKYLLLVPKDPEVLRGLITEERTEHWKRLDVSVLHLAVLDSILSVGSVEGNITYVKDAEDGESLVKGGSHQAAFFLNPTRVDQMKAVAECGEMMPQKSTYFYPKLLTGLVINKFDECKVKA